MTSGEHQLATEWAPGSAPIAVVMITLNEAHNMEAVLDNLTGFAQEVFIVDSFSKDQTIDIALRYGVAVVQRRFRNFGDQRNFALGHFDITADWVMILAPDERISRELKQNLVHCLSVTKAIGIAIDWRLWFMGYPLPVSHQIIRLWRNGFGRISDNEVNEHPVVVGPIDHVEGYLEHHDSPDLEHWLEKQNRYTTAEAIAAYQGLRMADEPKFLGTALQRRMWLKRHFHRIPMRFSFLFLYNYLWLGAWRAGWVGYVWARLRSDVMRLREYKRREMEMTGRIPASRPHGPGQPDPRVRQYD